MSGTSQPTTELKLGRTKFRTELQVRPDDIDMNQHVHNHITAPPSDSDEPTLTSFAPEARD